MYNFRKSSYSELHGECVEVALNAPGVVAVRDSKRPGGPVVRIGDGAWRAFGVGVVRGGE